MASRSVPCAIVSVPSFQLTANFSPASVVKVTGAVPAGAVEGADEGGCGAGGGVGGTPSCHPSRAPATASAMLPLIRW
jgi:hypothetical protein